MLPKTPETEQFWLAYKDHAGLGKADYVVVDFGDNPALNDELCALAVAGTKRATVSLARDYADGREPLPAVGDYVVLVDGANVPKAVWRTTDIEVKPLNDVDDAFAWDEGEGDRTRTSWLRNHRNEFMKQAARETFTFTDDITTVFERFTIVWPAEIADAHRGAG